MSFPNFPGKQDKTALLEPDALVAYRSRLGRLPKFEGLDGALFCLEKGMPRRMHRSVPVRFAGSMLGELYQVKRSPEVGVMANFGGGAPIVVELAEELVVLGARRMVLLTWGGTLQPGLSPGDIVIAERAIRDEGTSHHYLPPAKYIQSDEPLSSRLADEIRSLGGTCTLGTTWTTDAPFRETLEEVRQYQGEGVATVEMEAAGLFAIGQVRGVQTAAAIVVMDSLASLRWEVPDRLDGIQDSLALVYRAAIAALEKR
jgi:uridine phosphorylase